MWRDERNSKEISYFIEFSRCIIFDFISAPKWTRAQVESNTHFESFVNLFLFIFFGFVDILLVLFAFEKFSIFHCARFACVFWVISCAVATVLYRIKFHYTFFVVHKQRVVFFFDSKFVHFNICINFYVSWIFSLDMFASR